MDSKGKQDREELPTSLELVTVQESEVSVSLPTSGSNNLELGTKALTQIVREVLKEVFEARIQGISETLQIRCVDFYSKMILSADAGIIAHQSSSPFTNQVGGSSGGQNDSFGAKLASFHSLPDDHTGVCRGTWPCGFGN
ncbi:hypothetical protein J1N35_022703 [Gossypium stocksii]|uniref:Uncharacterized protein n=1 Tax=Gossypium stocksii TaxID=47602 RepID=A0A9D4A301_9ROSI|nr:hypothetical protein J1N35_022703 [Gossypium stocksii]